MNSPLRRHLTLVALLLVAFAPGLPGADAPPEAGELLDPATADASWRELFAALASHGAVSATFTERRWFSVRKEPVVLHGELRHSPERGLSLRYISPEEQMMIVDAQGILLRNAAGRSRALKADPRAPQVDALLLQVLRFDVAALHALFEMRGTRTAAHWRLALLPRTPELARAIGQLTVEGESAAVQRLEFSRGPKQRVEVLIEAARTGVVFSAEEQRKFFR